MKGERFRVSIHRQGKCPASVSTLGASDLPTDVHCEALGRTGGGWEPFLGDIHLVPFKKRHLWDPQFITTSETGTCGTSFSSFLRELDRIIWSLSPLGISTPSVCLLAFSFLFVFFSIFKHAWVVDALWEHHLIRVWVPTLPNSDPRGLRGSILLPLLPLTAQVTPLISRHHPSLATLWLKGCVMRLQGHEPYHPLLGSFHSLLLS